MLMIVSRCIAIVNHLFPIFTRSFDLMVSLRTLAMSVGASKQPERGVQPKQLHLMSERLG